MITTLVVLLALSSGGQQAAAPAQLQNSDCAACHEDVVKSFAFAPHADSCTGCHHPTAEHMEAPSAENVTRIPKEEACLSCHSAAKQQLMRATQAHVREGVACLDCHASGHAVAPAKPNLKAASQQLCGSCHAVQRAKFELPYTHRQGQNAFACTDCHSLHGEQRTNRLAMLQNSGACAECHSDIAAPRVFEHPPQLVEGCGSCHDAHGSANPRMLNRRSVSDLCLECHTDVARFHDISTSKYRVCNSCHSAVHGSNRDSHLFDQ